MKQEVQTKARGRAESRETMVNHGRPAPSLRREPSREDADLEDQAHSQALEEALKKGRTTLRHWDR